MRKMLCLILCFGAGEIFEASANSYVQKIEFTLDLRNQESAEAGMERLSGMMSAGRGPIVKIELRILLRETETTPNFPQNIVPEVAFTPATEAPNTDICQNNFDQAGKITIRSSYYLNFLLDISTNNPNITAFYFV